MAGANKKIIRRGGIAGVVADVLHRNLTQEPTEVGYYIKLSRTAMACQFEIFLLPEDRNYIPAVHEVFEEIDLLEQQISVYRPDSDISLLNRTAAQAPVQVEPRLYQLLLSGRQIGAETNGAFDLSIGALIRCWGFFERNGRIPLPEELASARAVSGWDCVEFDDDKHSIFFRRHCVELNLGSIGKGYALDRAAELLRKSGLRNFMIHAGQSSILASGNSTHGKGWEVGLQNPDGGDSFGSVCLQDQSMSTSGMGQQFFTDGNHRFGHILDPRSGHPAEQNRLVSVVAGNATTAEAFSTALFAMHEYDVRRCCDERKNLGVIIFPFSESPPTPEPLVLGIALKRCEEETI